MTKLIVITGFLGSGKTSFLKEYAKYLISINKSICIIENDYGPINIDMMFLNDLDCEKYMITSSDDVETYKRRLTTKLIQAGLQHFDYVLLEPSGVFNIDTIFDILYDDKIKNFIELKDIINIYDINTYNLSKEERFVLTSELSCAGKIVITKRKNNEVLDLNYINNILNEFGCNRVISNNDILYVEDIDFSNLNVSYYNYDYIHYNIKSFDSMFLLNKKYDLEKLKENTSILFSDKSYGNIIRIKGFAFDNKYVSVNFTKDNYDVFECNSFQDVIIIIGTSLNKDKIFSLLDTNYSENIN